MRIRVSNAPELSVSELAGSIKRTVEEAFGRVRVRGELGRVTIARSGHCYLDLKDDRAVINSIIWKGTMSRLTLRPEEGMEVIAEGKVSTYPGRSNYQLIIDRMELAGEGALMALLEKRKKTLAAEGLFAEERKRDLPFMPRVIGVVTSPTGAVIRDILHRISDRFPVHVLVWPVLVQGDKAAEQIAAAINGFNLLDGFPRPDTLIVARGGGSLEDLWCFNEEVVARAAANSKIPLISAVGHETDWTIIDYVADRRAPTPTGAAEIAVPVRDDWLETLADLGLRSVRGLRRTTQDGANRLKAARLPNVNTLLGPASQRLDAARLPTPVRLLEPQQNAIARLNLRNPKQLIDAKRGQLAAFRLPAPARTLDPKRNHLGQYSSRLMAGGPQLQRHIVQQDMQVGRLSRGLQSAQMRKLDDAKRRLDRAASLLDAYSYQGVLARGYALVTDEAGAVIRSARKPKTGDAVTLTFADGKRAAMIAGKGPKPAQPKKTQPDSNRSQQSLF